MKIMKRNQIIISVIALMLITVGYMSYNANIDNTTIQTGSLMDSEELAGIGDATLVSSNNVIENNIGDYNNVQVTIESAENVVQNVSAETSAAVSNDSDYFINSRLEREKMYSQMLETYEKILENASISSEQKAICQTEITNINNTKNSIMIAENLIKNKGFSDIVIFVNDNSISVIVNADKLEEAEIAQIQNIVSRELNAEADNIHISNR